MEAASISEELALGGIALAAAVAGTLTFAALSASSQIFGRTLIAGRDAGEIALTYDDGPNDNATPQLLDLLAAHNARATFFMLGKYVRLRPDLVRRVQAAGHLIGNHTETHPWLHLQPTRVIREEILACNRALEDALGQPIHYFRPPHGARRPAVLRVARELGLETVQWNAVGHDWLPIGPARILADVEAGLARARRRGVGGNILLHDGSDRDMGANRADTLTATAALLERFQVDGTRLVTIDVWG